MASSEKGVRGMKRKDMARLEMMGVGRARRMKLESSICSR